MAKAKIKNKSHAILPGRNDLHAYSILCFVMYVPTLHSDGDATYVNYLRLNEIWMMYCPDDMTIGYNGDVLQ